MSGIDPAEADGEISGDKEDNDDLDFDRLVENPSLVVDRIEVDELDVGEVEVGEPNMDSSQVDEL